MELAGHGRLIVVAKDRGHSASAAAQGGIAAAFSAEDSIRQHALDTLTCGRGLTDEDVAQLTAAEGKDRVKELLEMGCDFDRKPDGELHLTREGGHSRARVLHAQGDRTGQEIVRVLAKQLGEAGVKLTKAEMAVDLVMEGPRCTGAVLLFPGEKNFKYIRASKATILCTGGLGAIFSRNTNPASATGDGLAMAMRAGAEVADLEFVQFHPTVNYVAGESGFLISEAVRGEGGMLRNSSGRAFMLDYSAEADLAPRDVTARAIWREEKQGRGPVSLDIQKIETPFGQRFPGITAWLSSHGIDPNNGIPVSIGAHFAMGGVVTNMEGQTSLPGLFAAGEVACTGLHGANRMGSNSLLEGLVFGRRAGLAALRMQDAATGILPENFELNCPDLAQQKNFGQEVWSALGVERHAKDLGSMLDFLQTEKDSAAEVTSAGIEFRNARLLVKQLCLAALERRESRGAHQRTDFPDMSQTWDGIHLVWHGGDVRKVVGNLSKGMTTGF